MLSRERGQEEEPRESSRRIETCTDADSRELRTHGQGAEKERKSLNGTKEGQEQEEKTRNTTEKEKHNRKRETQQKQEKRGAG